MKAKSILSIVLFSFCPTFGIEILEPGYQVTTYSCYTCPGTEYAPREIAVDPYGSLYLSHLGRYDKNEGAVYRVDLDGIAHLWKDGLELPRRMVWAGQTDFGNKFYIAGAEIGYIHSVDLLGCFTPFAYVRDTHALALDRTGTYGGYLYSATRGYDKIYRVDSQGNSEVFSSFPGDHPGGPVDLCFDPGQNYGGLMYLADDSPSRADLSGIFSIDTQGQASRFASDIMRAWSIEIDPTGLFNGYFYASGTATLDEDSVFSLWRITPSGEVYEFALAGLDTGGLLTFVFGPDGAMYVPEYLSDYDVVIISKIVPEG